MKQKLFFALLLAEAAGCVLFCLLLENPADAFSCALAFPLAQLGRLLSALSGLGRVGNAFAVMLWAGMGLLPLWLLLYARTRRPLRAEDALLPVLSALLLTGLYLAVSPARLQALFPFVDAQNRSLALAIFGGVVWSAAIAWAVLRVLRQLSAGATEQLLVWLRVLLGLTAALFVLAAFGSQFAQLLSAIAELRAGNTGSEAGLGLSYLFAVLQYLVGALPCVLDAVTAILALQLTRCMQADRYSDASASAAQHLARWCRRSLTAVMVSVVGLNLAQLVFARGIRNFSGSVLLPVSSVLFVLLVLLFTRLLGENRQLKTDNDLFV